MWPSFIRNSRWFCPFLFLLGKLDLLSEAEALLLPPVTLLMDKKERKKRKETGLRVSSSFLLSVTLIVHPSLPLISPWWEISGKDASLFKAARPVGQRRVSFCGATQQPAPNVNVLNSFFFNGGSGWRTASLRLVYFLFSARLRHSSISQPTSIGWTRAISLDLERDTGLTGSCLHAGVRPSQHVLLWATPPTPPTPHLSHHHHPSLVPLWSAVRRTRGDIGKNIILPVQIKNAHSGR